MSWGEDLRVRREELGYSLQKVEDETKIRKVYLEALENENFSVLPPKVYSVGFVKNYARFLGLDVNQATQQFKLLAYGNEQPEEEHYVNTDNLNKPLLPSWLTATNVFAAAAFLLLAIWIGNYLVSYFAGQNIVDEQKPPVSEPDKPAGDQIPGDKEEPDDVEEPDETILPPEEVIVTVTATQNCWLRVIIDGVHDFEGTITAGDEKSFSGEESVIIKAGNAGGINIEFNGNEIGVFGSIGEVKEQEFTL